MTAFLTAFFAAVATSALIVMTKSWHMNFSADHFEGAQKFHATATPRIGGVAIAIGLIAAFLTQEAPASVMGPLLIASALPFSIGLFEDITNNGGVKRRLFVIAFGGLLFCLLTGQWVRYVGVPGIDALIAISVVGVAFTVLALTGAANAINIIDGFNGLAGGVAVIILGALAFIAQKVGDGALAMVLLGFIGAVSGFLLLNFPKGKIFLGDGGAYLVGFLLGICAILLPMRNPDVSPWVALLACAYPLLEVLFSVYRKSKREGYSPTQPDGVHLHMLVYRRITRHRFKRAPVVYRNAATSPFLWAFATGPALGAILFYDRQSLLIATLALSTLAYGAIYRRLTRFRWLPQTSYLSLPIRAPHGATASSK